MRNLLLMVLLVALTMSCDDENQNTPDASDVSPTQSDTGIDVKTTSKDAGEDFTAQDASKDSEEKDQDADLNDGTADTGDPEDMGKDTSPDMADPFPGRPKGQCSTSTDCPDNPNGRQCGPIPGGACLVCSADDANCPSGSTCSQFGACIAECQTETDCAPGLRCTSRGQCGAMRCSQGVCPIAGLACTQSGLCTRQDCNGDPNLCEMGTTCKSGFCVLDR